MADERVTSCFPLWFSVASVISVVKSFAPDLHSQFIQHSALSIQHYFPRRGAAGR